MYVRLYPNQAPVRRQSYALLASPKETEVIMRRLPDGQEQRFAFSRVFSPEFSSQNVYSEIPQLQHFFQGEDAFVMILGREQSGKHFSFLGLMLYVLEQDRDYSITIGDISENSKGCSPELRERLAQASQVYDNCKISIGSATLTVFRAPSYAPQNLLLYSAVLSPKIYFSTIPQLQIFRLEEIFRKGRFERNVCFLASFPFAGSETSGRRCSLSSFLEYLSSLGAKCFKQQSESDELDIIHNIAEIEQRFKQRYDDAMEENKQLEATLDEERLRFATELRDLEGQLQEQIIQNELLSTKMFALEQDNILLEEQIQGMEGDVLKMGAETSVGTRESLRERLQLQKSAGEGRRTGDVCEKEKTKDSRLIYEYKEVEEE